MTVNNPYLPAGLNADAVTQNVNLNQNSDTSPVILATGRHGDQLISQVHGKRYAKSSRGNLFWGTSGTAGASLLAPGGTTGGFVLFNPANSGIYMEVEKFSITGASTETDVVSGIALEGSVQTPTGTLTGATITSLPLGLTTLGVGGNLGAGGAKGRLYKACTLTAMTFLGGLGMTIQATTQPIQVGIVDFDGTVILAPGMAVNFVSAITQGATFMICDVFWSEFLP